MGRWRWLSMLGVLLVAGCGGASPAGSVSASASDRTSAQPTAVPLDQCLVGDWQTSGGFTSPTGSGLAGTVFHVSSNGTSTLSFQDSTQWIGSDGQLYQFLGTDRFTVNTANLGGEHLLTFLNENTGQVTESTPSGSVGPPSGPIMVEAQYTCSSTRLTLTFLPGTGLELFDAATASFTR